MTKDIFQPSEPAAEAVASLLYALGANARQEAALPLIRDICAKASDLLAADRSRAFEAMSSILDDGRASIPWPAPSTKPADVDVVLVAPQPRELEAVKDVFKTTFAVEHRNGRTYYEFTWQGATGDKLRCVIASLVGPGNVNAAVEAAEVGRHYRASLWILVGMCAGLPDPSPIGAVVLPQKVWDYESGRLLTGSFEPRPDVISRSSEVNSVLHHFESDRETREMLERRLSDARARAVEVDGEECVPAGFKFRLDLRGKVVASGEKLLRDGELLPGLHSNQHQGITIGDMESYGFARACSGVPWLVARGVADYGDGTKTKLHQYFSTMLAAETVRALLESDFVLPLLERIEVMVRF
ncbi:MAG: hypothetical protein FWD59_02555 [Micrococcales bacterium]|nr:hypothetical protein [Micrococcales bacterium]